ncbi:MAG TPA: hypothetical protein VJU77_07635 [Chthoniobacterales bacterium]|nr:hypothetical protein [Chthoniobacterales bacterium]
MKCPRRWVTAVAVLVFFPGIGDGGVFTVVNSNSSGPGSLVQAVNDANSVAGPHQIVFDIPGPGVHIIDLNKEGVAVGSSITVDGYTQPGASPNTLTVGNNAVILIELDGGGPFAKGSGALLMYGNDSVVRGLSFTGFSGPDADYAAISIGSAIPEYGFRNRVEGNFIGLTPDGVTLNGNDYGIYFFGGTGNTVGGNTPAARNLISGNRVGIFAGVNSTIIGNYFGTDASGFRQGYGNDTAISTGHSIIGTGEPGAGNVFADNGIAIQAFSGNSIIRGNLIGLLPDGSPSFGNGIGITSAGFDTIGGLEPGQGNVIAYNTTGVLAGQTSILSNLFYGNSSIDIDIGPHGRTENDFGDVDQVQNFPVILSVTRTPESTTVTGGLNSTPSTDFTLQFFANGATITAPQTLLGTEKVMTNSFGDAPFSFSFPIQTLADQFITVTATNPENETSEFFPSDDRVEPANISTRGYVGTGNDVLIGGFIRGNGFLRTLLIRALGPSLNVSGALADPTLVVRRSNGQIVAQNDNWKTSQEQEIRDTGLAPANDLEAAVLTPILGSPFVDNRQFTVEVSGSNGGVGIGTVEIYELGSGDNSTELLNISTRGRVGTGDSVLIGGTIIHGSAPQKLVIRAIGPDLAGAGVPGALQDPTLEIRDAAGTLLASNDDWRSDQEQEIINSGLAPQDNRDSAILMTLVPTSYTAIVRGKGGTTGIALIELYNLN